MASALKIPPACREYAGIGFGVGLIAGTSLLAAGTASAAVGIPLWLIGERRETRVAVAPMQLALQW